MLSDLTKTTHLNVLTVNLRAVRHNLERLRKKLPSTRILVMVKALAYGTNHLHMAKFLTENRIDCLGVSFVEEALELRESGIDSDILVLNAIPLECPLIVEYDLQIAISDLNFLQSLENECAKQQRKIKVHLHVETGMGRLGCNLEDVLELALRADQSEWVQLEGIMTHFAAADDSKEDNFTRGQAHKFVKAIESLENKGITIPWKHACNSAAACRFNFSQFNMARIGIALYGLGGSEEVKQSLPLLSALSLHTTIVGITTYKKGDTISYGRTFNIADDETSIAVLPIGYHDGLHRSYSNRAGALINGEYAPFVGNICMDYMMVDVTGIKNIKIGDPVLLFGEDQQGNYYSPELFASHGKTLVYELIACLGPRIKRLFVD